mmetsp:Transcript_36822/g.85078  ORF Transcript_36822/g.85078 Transcript_36822/m.85078 type:complete len:492 (-) Transcript_36822:42-1517(-)
MQTEDVVKSAFFSADLDKSGTLDIQEFGRLLQLLNPSTWSDERLQRFFLRADKDGSGRVDLEETLDWLLAKEPPKIEVDAEPTKEPIKLESPSKTESPSKAKPRTFEMSRLMRAFEEADLNHDGHLEKEEFASVLMSLDPKKFSDPKKLSVAFQRADDDHNGALDSREVETWLRKYFAKNAPDDVEELYMLLTWRDGRNAGPLRLDDLLQAFLQCSSAGLNCHLGKLVPQSLEGDAEPREVSPMEFVLLLEYLREHRETSEDDLMQLLASSKWRRRINQKVLKRSFSGDLLSLLRGLGVNPNTPVGVGLFRQLLSALSALLRIDRQHLLMYFTWSKTQLLQMTDAMAEKVMEQVFLKVSKGGESLLSQGIVENDFYRVCYSMDVLDTKEGKRGIPRGQIAILFQELSRGLPQKLLERELRKYPYRHARKDSKPVERKKGSPRLFEIKGTAQLSVMLEMLWKALPGRPFPTAIEMVLHFLQKSSDQAAKRRF